MAILRYLPAASLLAGIARASSGTFDFLTLNVAGLPEILNSNEVPGDKEDNAGYIGTHLAEGGFDVVHMQEDFNYHAYIYRTDNHTYRTATSGGVPFGSGLNTVANYGWSSFERIKWDKCDIDEGDCLTPKGFTFMRMQIEDIEIDFYNLHADAGSENGDAEARSAGVDQVLDYIEANSADRAVIIGGDTNDRWTNAARSIDKYTDAGFEDVWVQLINNGVYPTAGAAADPCGTPAASNTCEVVDKIFFRSGGGVTVDATSFTYASSTFVQPDGNILSDHNPLLVNFAWTS
ncbi:Endonuclease/Exonuclease/phosphatase family [Geosmithia morbida]|uniref:Endonuclease/Exonuclease/phosphatase family n=1 Tax=Geosmithia morbida TaxID=1094350 RepID=A0A9P4YQA4_9HYPO|nr:Endonuclease/Exonuclease/phosphatase family [Geosmithia morbida]KAF4120597.1 Endonuclease/Exonuclease/phosphatase family [Geosmithia morbida]